MRFSVAPLISFDVRPVPHSCFPIALTRTFCHETPFPLHMSAPLFRTGVGTCTVCSHTFPCPFFLLSSSLCFVKSTRLPQSPVLYVTRSLAALIHKCPGSPTQYTLLSLFFFSTFQAGPGPLGSPPLYLLLSLGPLSTPTGPHSLFFPLSLVPHFETRTPLCQCLSFVFPPVRFLCVAVRP